MVEVKQTKEEAQFKERLTRLLEGKLEAEVKPFASYSAHVILPGAWKGKRVRVEVINEQ